MSSEPSFYFNEHVEIIPNFWLYFHYMDGEFTLYVWTQVYLEGIDEFDSSSQISYCFLCHKSIGYACWWFQQTSLILKFIQTPDQINWSVLDVWSLGQNGGMIFPYCVTPLSNCISKSTDDLLANENPSFCVSACGISLHPFVCVNEHFNVPLMKDVTLSPNRNRWSFCYRCLFSYSRSKC